MEVTAYGIHNILLKQTFEVCKVKILDTFPVFDTMQVLTYIQLYITNYNKNKLTVVIIV